MQLATLRQQLESLGAGPHHQTLFLRAWVRGDLPEGIANGRKVQYPSRLLNAVPALTAALESLARVVTEHPAADGSARLLVRLAGGQSVETVLLPPQGVCVSTQVGCAVGCVFCMTGRAGLIRQLDSTELVAQTVLARRRGPLRRVVFMGMGEPSHNLDNVLEAIALLGGEGGLPHKNLVFSTVGDRRVFERLPRAAVRPALAISLHTTKPDLRRDLLPRAPALEPAELVGLAERYARTTGHPIQYQWTLLAGVNDGDDELEALVALLAGHYAMVNFIPYNRIEGADHQRPEPERAWEMARFLKRHGVLATVRRSAGQDVDGACGQLRARHDDGTPLLHPRRQAALAS